MLDSTANILKLLGDKTRLSMIGLLSHNECCVCEFVEVFQMTQPAISQHLRKLKDAKLVNEKRKGQWIIYSLNSESEYYPLVLDVLKYIPSQAEKINEIEQKGLRGDLNC
ncbi:MAG: ArsR family transcriptional regulator [Bacillales bacterium]|nr:ArsR family transcriptional regulator [Bacillales bacterium]